MTESILERDVELEAIERFVCAFSEGPSVMTLEGEAGIGKTTLWTVAVRISESRGDLVLRAGPTQTEAAFSFAALSDLFSEIFESLRGQIPPQQERALAAALLIANENDLVDLRSVAIATTGILKLLTDKQPVLLAIDDAQWLDEASKRVLEFAVRRLSGSVGILVATRAIPGDVGPLGLARALPPSRLQHLMLGPLSFSAVGHLLRDRIGISFPRSTLSRVVTTSGGNPYFALEIARSLANESSSHWVDERLPLPLSLRELMRGRIAALSINAQQAGLIAAASVDPTVTLLRQAMPSASSADTALGECEGADVLVLDGDRVRFTHPLLASAIYDAAPADQRRDLHRQLATHVRSVEERGIHLARSVIGIDAEAADAIERAARRASLRGANEAAAELFDAARRITPPESVDALARRLLGSAHAQNAVGSFDAARSLAEMALAQSDDGSLGAEALVLLATLDWFDGAAEAATSRVEQALEQVDDDADRKAAIYAKFVRYNFSHDVSRAIHYADAALALLEHERQPALVAHMLIDRFFASALHGDCASLQVLERGLALEHVSFPDLPNGPQPMPLIWFQCADDIDSARERYAWEDAWYREHGEEIWQADRRSHQAVAELRAGSWREAERLIEESCSVMEQFDVHGPRAMVFEKRAH